MGNPLREGVPLLSKVVQTFLGQVACCLLKAGSLLHAGVDGAKMAFHSYLVNA